jgi:hypothetical protein
VVVNPPGDERSRVEHDNGRRIAMIRRPSCQALPRLPRRATRAAGVPRLGRTGVQRDAVPAAFGRQLTRQTGLARSPLVLAHSVTRECFVHR